MRWLGIGGVSLVVLASPAAAQQAPAQQIEVTLQDALQRAQQVQPNMVQALGVAQSKGKRAQQQLQISIDKLHAGSATRSDSLRSTVEYGNARIALLQAQANLATAQANLGRQIGVDAPVRALPDTTLPALPDT